MIIPLRDISKWYAEEDARKASNSQKWAGALVKLTVEKDGQSPLQLGCILKPGDDWHRLMGTLSHSVISAIENPELMEPVADALAPRP